MNNEDVLLVSFLDGVSLDSRQEVAVATGLTSGTLYTLSDRVLRCVPESIIYTKLYPHGIKPLPSLSEWMETHGDDFDDVDMSLARFLDPVLN